MDCDSPSDLAEPVLNAVKCSATSLGEGGVLERSLVPFKSLHWSEYEGGCVHRDDLLEYEKTIVEAKRDVVPN